MSQRPMSFKEFDELKLAKPILKTPLHNFVESFVDNVIRDRVTIIEKGSIVYCDLLFGQAEHSGIYVGSDLIVHLDGTGNIELVTPKEFLQRLNGFNSAISIYSSCIGTRSIGSDMIAKRAFSMVGKTREYNMITNNCHQFTSGCITGNFENSDNFLWMLKNTASKVLNVNDWRVWDKDY
mgnify:FL=1